VYAPRYLPSGAKETSATAARLSTFASLVGAIALFACGADQSAGQGAHAAESAGEPAAATSDAGPPTAQPPSGRGRAEPERSCQSEADSDLDADGFSLRDGDCDDCEPRVNPAAYDFADDEVDDDCSGDAAAPDDQCDRALPLEASDPDDAARALGICSFPGANGRGWGVVSARFTDAHGTGRLSDPRAVGLLPGFGVVAPREGAALLALSSGVARAPGQPGYTADCDALDAVCPMGGVFDCSGAAPPPTGFPKQSAGCGELPPAAQPAKVFNQAALELTLRVPINASALAFDSIFYTYEYPAFICHEFNDFYVVFKQPRATGAVDDNIVIDEQGDPIGVNSALLAVCDQSAQKSDGGVKRFACEQGTALLEGTGYGPRETTCAQAGGASTGWLRTTAPVVPGELITLRFAIWDTNDVMLDSTVLIDHLRWERAPMPMQTSPLF
jgi:hypothetical protein